MYHKKLRVFEAFSGYGSHSLQLQDMGIQHEVVGTSEIDPYAIVAYSAVHENFAGTDGISHEQMEKFLQSKNIGYDFKKEKFPRMPKKRLEQTYSAAIGQKCYGDISLLKIEDLPEMDLFTFSFPCQDISVAGSQKGLNEDSGTRSSLLWECKKVIEGKRPAFTMMENVKNLVGKRHKHNFDKWLEWMDNIGYNNYWKVINAKNCGIPQNRERVFLVSIRKDVDDGSFKFEDDFDSGLRLKDFLEINVDEKYYIKNERVNELLSVIKDGKQGSLPELDDVPLSSREHRSGGWKEDVGTLCARDYKDPKVIAEPMVVASRGRYGEDGSIEQKLEPNKSGYTNTITTVQKDNLVLEPNELQFVGGIGDKDWIGDNKELPRNYPQGNRVYSIDGIACSQTSNGGGIGGPTGLYLDNPNELRLHTILSGGKWDKVYTSSKLVYDEEGISPTILTCTSGYMEPKVARQETIKQGCTVAEDGDSSNGYRIRKLTPRECFRLMGLTDTEIDRIQSSGVSNSQQYKLAGNSIVKQCMTFLKNLPYENIGVVIK